jgi:hypothetical protein
LENVKTSKENENVRAELGVPAPKVPTSLSVLFVDDEVTLLRLVADLMEEFGFAVIVARSFGGDIRHGEHCRD